MKEVVQAYVEWGIFITIIIAMLGLIIGGFWVILSKIIGLRRDVSTEISNLKTEVALSSRQNISDKENISKLWETVNTMSQQRNTDTLEFTKTIGSLNTTLGKIEVTLENMGSTLEKINTKQEEQNKELNELKSK